MDSITHALYRAIVVEDKQQSPQDRNVLPHLKTTGLVPLHKRKAVRDLYADAEETAQHIALTKNCHAELLALQLEFIAAGFNVPAGMVECGADVLLEQGAVSLYVPCDVGPDTWWACLRAAPEGSSRRTGWTENIC